MSAAFDVMAYVQGPYARVDDERTDLDLTIIGELPRELNGMFVQNTPNPRFAPVGWHHWFDGDGMLHGVHLEDGKATYRNRYVQTEALAADVEAGRALRPGILMPIETGHAGGPDKNTANTDVIWFNGKLLCTWWIGGRPYAVEVPSLETVGEEDFGGTLSQLGMTAHPKLDPRTGELVFMRYGVYEEPWLQCGVVSAEGVVSHQAVIDVPTPSLYHDLALTEQYTVLMHFPMRWDLDKIKQGKRRVRFHKDEPARFGILPRHGGSSDVRWFEAETCYCYHVVNAWEETNERGEELVHLLACRIDSPIPDKPREEDAPIPRLFFLRLEPYLHQWTFNLTTGTTSERRLDDVPTEFPRMNDALFGTKARYAWHPRVKMGKTLLFDGCIRYDLDRGTSTQFTWGEHRIGTETVFAPRPGAKAEDDGWIMTFVTDLSTDKSELVVLDAAQVEAGPIARVMLPRRVPFGFHAHWAPGPF